MQNTRKLEWQAKSSRIRDSLRVWSLQNENIKRQSAPDTISIGGRVDLLPRSLFLNEDQTGRDDVEIPTLIDGPSHGGFAAESQQLAPGTLFTYDGRASSRQYAVFVCNIGIQTLLVLENGCWLLERMQSMRKFFTTRQGVPIPNFLSAVDLDQLKEHMPKRNIARPVADGEGMADIPMSAPLPSEVTSGFLTKIRTFSTEVSMYRREFAQSVNAMWHKLADETEYRMMTLEDCLLEGLGLHYEALSGAQKMAIVDEIGHLDTMTLLQTAETASVLVMPKKMQEDFQKVVEWARQYQDAAARAAIGENVSTRLGENPLTAFIDKARRLILLSRKSRVPTESTGLGPAPILSGHEEGMLQRVPTNIEFSLEDRMFIDYIWTTCFRIPTPRHRGPLKFLSTTSLIMRAVGAYPNLRLSPAVARLFLKEIGCADPWDAHTQDLALPLPGGKVTNRADMLQKELAKFERDFEQLKENGKDADLDTMSHLRKDWGSLPAFAIDNDEFSKFAEDAISFEDTGNGQGSWIHVHVSHVSAFIRRGEVLERFARYRGTSCFTVDSSLPVGMLPASVCRYFSLKENSRVLTVSTLVGNDGTVSEVKISAGILREVVELGTNDVNSALGVEESTASETSVLSVGRPLTRKAAPIVVKKRASAMKYKDTLRKLHSLLQQRRLKREIELPQPIALPRNTFEVQLSVHGVEKFNKYREKESYHWRGDPHITVTARQRVGVETGVSRSNDLVTQAMRLACESAGQWFTERRIPAIFLGTEASANNSFGKIAQRRSHEQVRMPMFVRSSAPLPYWNIHVKSYCNITSPLRRYMDLVAMWQADAYLKAEAQGVVLSGAPMTDEDNLTFSKSDIDDYLRVDAHASDTIEAVTRRIKSSYALQALFRAFHFKEAPLPSKWEVIVTEPHKYSGGLVEQQAMGFLIPIGLPCSIVSSTTGWEKKAKHGQFLPVTISTIDMVRTEVQCMAVGPPTDEQTLTAMFHASDNTDH